MYCVNCGCKAIKQALYCHKCGTIFPVDTEKSINSNDLKNELDREALVIYLKDLLALECAKNKLAEKIKETRTQINYIKENNCYYMYKISNYDKVHLRFDGNKYYVALDKNGYVNVLETFENLYWNEVVSKIKTRLKWKIPSNGGFFSYCTSKERESICKKNFWDIFSKFKKYAPNEFKENIEKMECLNSKVNSISAELDKAEQLLTNAYNINIIPNQFRNYYAVYFISDYISTSNETLSSAFLNLNLDEIKQKIDNVIQNQQEIILNQSIIMAQNDIMIQQNKQKLNTLSKIENNTERAAQYAQIAANNAEACAWIGFANYIKD